MNKDDGHVRPEMPQKPKWVFVMALSCSDEARAASGDSLAGIAGSVTLNARVAWELRRPPRLRKARMVALRSFHLAPASSRRFRKTQEGFVPAFPGSTAARSGCLSLT